MDPESTEVLNGLVIRWKTRVDQWHVSAQSLENEPFDYDKLDSHIEMLSRHVESLAHIQNALQELEKFRMGLVQIRATMNTKKAEEEKEKESKQEGPRVLNLDKELEDVEAEMRKLHCHNEEFLMRYLQVKDDYRAPIETMPLPYGFRCHKQYLLEVDLLKTRLHNAMKQAENYQTILRDGNDMDLQKVTVDLNHCLNTQRNLQASLYYFLMHVQPIDAEAFHAQCGALIQRRMLCLEAKRMQQIQSLLASK